jgi:hypothetical protein
MTLISITLIFPSPCPEMALISITLQDIVDSKEMLDKQLEEVTEEAARLQVSAFLQPGLLHPRLQVRHSCNQGWRTQGCRSHPRLHVCRSVRSCNQGQCVVATGVVAPKVGRFLKSPPTLLMQTLGRGLSACRSVVLLGLLQMGLLLPKVGGSRVGGS